LGTYYYLAPYTACDPSPIGFLTPGMVEKANHYVDRLNEMVRDLAAEEDTGLADLNVDLSFINGHPLYYLNCNHLNSVGNFFAALVWWLRLAPYLG
jgi:hypothetical protein